MLLNRTHLKEDGHERGGALNPDYRFHSPKPLNRRKADSNPWDAVQPGIIAGRSAPLVFLFSTMHYIY